MRVFNTGNHRKRVIFIYRIFYSSYISGLEQQKLHDVCLLFQLLLPAHPHLCVLCEGDMKQHGMNPFIYSFIRLFIAQLISLSIHSLSTSFPF
jgi:hypothetical protein